jgi:hypothetical protein
MELTMGLRGIFFMNFWFPIGPRGLGIIRKDTLLDNKIRG